MNLGANGLPNSQNSKKVSQSANISKLRELGKKDNSKKESEIINPFTNQAMSNQGNQFNMNPMMEESATMHSLLSDSSVPIETKKKFWWVFTRDNSLTFLDEKRKKDKMLNFDIIRIDSLNSTPYYDYTFETEKEFNIIRNAIEVKYDRALGTNKASQLNERIAQKSQFNENRQISKDESQGASAGFMSKLLGRR